MFTWASFSFNCASFSSSTCPCDWPALRASNFVLAFWSASWRATSCVSSVDFSLWYVLSVVFWLANVDFNSANCVCSACNWLCFVARFAFRVESVWLAVATSAFLSDNSFCADARLAFAVFSSAWSVGSTFWSNFALAASKRVCAFVKFEVAIESVNLALDTLVLFALTWLFTALNCSTNSADVTRGVLFSS